MAGSTEIYICKPGQALTDGRVEYGDMTTKAEAENDAIERIRCDSSIGKIAYYVIRPNDEFKCILTKQNPDAVLPEIGAAIGASGIKFQAVLALALAPHALYSRRSASEFSRRPAGRSAVNRGIT